MRMWFLVLICIHTLLWAGCHAMPKLHKLRSNENLLAKAVDSTQPSRGAWRKLLEVTTANSRQAIQEETENVTVVDTESKSKSTAITGKADVDLAEKGQIAGDANNTDVVKADLAVPSISQREEGKAARAAAHVTQEDASKAEEPKVDANEGVPREKRPSEQIKGDLVKQNDTHTAGIEKVEFSTIKQTAETQAVQIEEKPTSSTGKDGSVKQVETGKNAQLTQSVHASKAVETETKGDASSSEKLLAKKVNLVEPNNGSNVDTEGLDVIPNVGTQDITKLDKLPESVKEDSSPVAPVDDGKHHSIPQQDEETPDKEKLLESKQQDHQTKESADSGENADSTEGLAELNPIRMVETSKDMKETDPGDTTSGAETTETEGVDKEKAADEDGHASLERADKPNSNTDSSDEPTSDIADAKVGDDKVEDTDDQSSASENKEEKSDKIEEVAEAQSNEKEDEKQGLAIDIEDRHSQDNIPEEVATAQTIEKVERKQELGNDTEDGQSEGKTTQSTEERAEQNQGLDKGTTETNDDNEAEDHDAKEDVSIFVKSDDETEAATQEVERQLEALKRDSVIETMVEQTQQTDPSEDEYDIIQELADLPSKFQLTAGKVADHLRPDVIKWTDTSKVYFNRANQQITESFSPLIGKQYAPFFASMISYGVLLLPLIVVILLFDHIKALFSLQKVLLFINIYLAAYFATLWLASFIIGLEPMSFFYLNSLSNYLSLQLLQAFGYVIYLILQSANAIYACTSDTLVGKITSTLQWVVAMGIGLHYYVTVFHPAVASKPPHTSWKFYAVYTAAFLILCLFARIRWVKKQYVTSGRSVADKKS